RHQNLQCMLLPSPGWLVLNQPITRGFGGFDHYQLALPVIAWAYWPGTRIAPWRLPTPSMKLSCPLADGGDRPGPFAGKIATIHDEARIDAQNDATLRIALYSMAGTPRARRPSRSLFRSGAGHASRHGRRASLP
ncbi:hypothetical protein, partial [Burkholderia gladioli]|uniref:hypothetical protein n=1 Tax=Burkholderia gladioli TaxID=28095 RepID=UPI003F7960F7